MFIYVGKYNKNSIKSLELEVDHFDEEFFYSKNKSKKFFNDIVDINNEYIIIFIDGIILNSTELKKKYKSDWETTISKMYHEYGLKFFKHLRGSFYGFIYLKNTMKWTVFSDHIGSKQVYFYENKKILIISNSISKIYHFLSKSSVNHTLSINSSYMLLSYGFMLEDNTLSKQVKRLLPGCYLEFRSEEIPEVIEYHAIDNSPVKMDLNEYIENIDYYFRQAIKRQFDKDIEYGYQHAVSLSGGLDSRMTSLVANENGFKNQFNFTFSQIDYLDEIISKTIASDYGHDYSFIPLDNGEYLFDIEKVINLNGGNSLYNGLAHAFYGYDKLNFENYGINHTGQLGDIILGSYSKSKVQNQSWEMGDGAYSLGMIKKVIRTPKLPYRNYEHFVLFNRGFIGTNSGLLASQRYTETMSPFYDVDFMDFVLSIPIKFRFNHYIYIKWILEKYPKAADYKWEKTNDKITSKQWIKYKHRLYTLNEFKHKTFNEILRRLGLSSHIKGMNPFDYWYKSNHRLKKFINEYYNDHINLVANEKLKKDLNYAFKKSGCSEKLQVLSLLASIKLFFCS
tara:strand:+ start:39474 stop:41171 length:1698 start_codon:yes stop_codon:yes gene_type:complete